MASPNARYSDFRPTQFDRHIHLEGREDWFVAPVFLNRDSTAAQIRRFNSTVKRLGGESDTVEVHRFGHWANGWFELILSKEEAT